jgi:hypothetical protein
MKTMIHYFALSLVSGFFLLTGCNREMPGDEGNNSPLVLKSAGLPSVSGEATTNLWTFHGQYPDGIKKHVSFQARKMPDGTVKGSGVLHYVAGNLELKFDIRCMTISGNKAKLSGVITSTTDDPTLVGKWCYFMVIDNGVGSGAEPDLMSEVLAYIPGEYNCADIPDNIELWEIDEGNIMVKP